MRQLLILALLLVLSALVGCEKVQVAEVQKCSKVVETKYYKNKIFGVLESYPHRYYVLEDGREVNGELHQFRNGEEYCEYQWVHGNTNAPEVQRGSIGSPCPADKCPELQKSPQ